MYNKVLDNSVTKKSIKYMSTVLLYSHYENKLTFEITKNDDFSYLYCFNLKILFMGTWNF